MLKAFTIVELIVAMVLSTTVASIVYIVYKNSVILYNQRQKNSDKDEELLSFSTNIGNELRMAYRVEFSDSLLTIINNEKSPVTYEFIYPEILRHMNNKIDTIRIGYKEFNISFLGELPPVIEIFDIIIDSNHGTIDTLKNLVSYDNEFKYKYLNSNSQSSLK